MTFTSERQYRNALARDKGSASLYEQQRERRTIGSAEKLRDLSVSEQEARGRALAALARMRERGDPLERAARETGTTPNTVLRYAGSALEQRGGRYVPKPYDRLARRVEFLTPAGRVALPVRDSRSASEIARYMNAVRWYLETGDAGKLRRFRDRSVTVDKLHYPFITDPDTLDRLAGAGELRFDSLYRLAA